MKKVYIQTWALVSICENPETNKYEVVSSEHPSNEQMTERLNATGSLVFSEDGRLVNKETFEPHI